MTNERQLGPNVEELNKIFQQLIELSAEAICGAKILNDIKDSDDKDSIVKQLNKLKEIDGKRERLISNLLVEVVCAINSHDRQIVSTDEKLEKIYSLLEQIHEKLNASIETSKCMIKLVEELHD